MKSDASVKRWTFVVAKGFGIGIWRMQLFPKIIFWTFSFGPFTWHLEIIK